MTKIPVVTQNFSSPDVFCDSPLMLLPQSSSIPPLPDRDQEGFSQLLLHDLHRHRQSYVQSYTAFETLKKRQDFVLRQENLRSLQSFEQRVTAKQEQSLDQSLHSYEQCFVKVINGNLTPTRTHAERPKSAKIFSPSFDRFHAHQLSHIPATPLDPPTIIPFHRYQRSHRPRVIPKHRSQPSIQRSAQCLHDAFQSSHSLNQSQPFVSFTESYLQRYTDRSSGRFSVGPAGEAAIETMSDIQERTEVGDRQSDVKQRGSDGQKHSSSQTRRHEPRIKSADYHRLRTTPSSRNTNTPSSTPQITYQDAVQDGLTTTTRDETQQPRSKLSSVQEKHRRASQQSSGQNSSGHGRSTPKRPKSSAVKKQQITIDLTTNKTMDGSSPVITGTDDILKKSMTVQNYGNSTGEAPAPSSVLQRSSVSNASKIISSKGTSIPASSLLHRPSLRTTDSTPGSKQNFDNVFTQMTSLPSKLTEQGPGIASPELNSTLGTMTAAMESGAALTTATASVTEEKTAKADSVAMNGAGAGDAVDPRKRLRRGPFDPNESMKDLIAFELDVIGRQQRGLKKTRFFLDGKDKGQTEDLLPVKENQGALDLLEKIRQSVTATNLGQYPVSQRNCRFELPHDLKLLETLTPLEYLAKYCRLSARRHHHYKRIFDKYRNNQYRFESNQLRTAIRDVHADVFTPTHHEQLARLINIGNEQHQLTFETFAGILALCERILCDSQSFRSGLDEHDLAKDTIEKCDFDSLDRKLDGLNISETMKNLLRAL